MGGAAKAVGNVFGELTGVNERKRDREAKKLMAQAQAESNKLLQEVEDQKAREAQAEAEANRLRELKQQGDRNASKGRRSTIRAGIGGGTMFSSADQKAIRTLLGE